MTDISPEILRKEYTVAKFEDHIHGNQPLNLICIEPNCKEGYIAICPECYIEKHEGHKFVSY